MAVLDTSQLSAMKSGRDHYSPSSQYDDSDALRLIEERYRDDQREYLKHPFEKQWLVNIAFFQGHQHIVWDDTLRSLREPKTPSWRVRLVANEVWPLILRSIALMTNTKIPWKVIPTSTDKEDIDAARVAQLVLEHYHRTLGIDELRIEAEYWAQIAGNAFFKVTWDPEEGIPERIYIDPRSGDPIPNYVLEANPEVKSALDGQRSYQEFRTGAPKIDVVNPFRIMVDPFVARQKDLRWMMEVTDKPMSDIYNRWPDQAGEVNPGRNHNLSSWYERRLLHINGIFGYSGYIEGRKYSEDSALVKELWMAPYNDGKKSYPYGRHIIVAGDKVLVNGENPYKRIGFPDAGFPYVKIGYSMIPGRYWDSSQVEHHIPLQRANNMVRSKVIESFKLMGMPKWIVPYKADLKQSAINSRPGEVIEFDHLATGGIPPQQISPPNMPPYYMDIINRNAETMQQIAAQPGPVQGQPGPGRQSGVATKALQEKALLPLNPLIRQREIAHAKMGAMILRIVGANMTEEQVLKIYGRDGAHEVRKFKGADLRGNYDAYIPEGSMIPQTKAEIYELTQVLAQMGALNPVQKSQDRQAILRATRYYEEEEWFRAEEADRRRSRVENDMMSNIANPQIPTVKDFDDHSIHVMEHDIFRKSDVYEKLPQELKAAIDAHVAQHNEHLQRAMEQQMQMMMAQKGTQGQKGKPSAPAPSGGSQAQGFMT